MGRSPTVQRASYAFQQISDSVNGNGFGINLTDRVFCLYFFVVVVSLLLIQPRFVMDIDYTKVDKETAYHLSYRKLAGWILILHLPIIMLLMFEGEHEQGRR